MYGTRGRQILCHDDLAPDYAAALARAYNNWAADYCKSDPRRLKFAAQIAMHDVASAVAEARRCVGELGAVAVVGTPNPVNGQHLHDEVCEPLWHELEQLNVPIGFHPTGTTRSGTMPGGASSGTPISTRSPMPSATRSN
jgi:predicted TIM-barrel fold metal-dependent hydrolase